jgi:carbonic anhydrase/acetyltransferase-like protein (isoleucine patch superfamily)
MKIILRIISKISRLLFILINRKAFGSLESGAYLFSPYRIDGAESIFMGSNSVLQKGGWLYCKGLEGKKASIMIGNSCVFGYNNHITAICSIKIGDNVLTANNVYISDNNHAYEDIGRPIMYQPQVYKGSVEIGTGSWLGENVCVLGARIGRNCVIGSNAVVTTDIPDYCVAVGIPAKVIRRYDINIGKWIAVNEDPSNS